VDGTGGYPAGVVGGHEPCPGWYNWDGGGAGSC